jgi:Ca2+-binding EF-hand superfamily protein
MHMPQSFRAALTVMALLAGSSLSAGEGEKKDKESAKPANATITKIDANKGEITLKVTGESGKIQEKTFRLTDDVRLLDETGRVVHIAVFESGNDALVVESEGKLVELRRVPNRGRTQQLSDAVRTRIELTDCEEGCMEDLQKIYDMLRKLDTEKNGKLDPKALKIEADNLLQERVKEAFSRLDTNKDGKISKEEARGLIKEHFDRIDTNKDGSIDFDELLKAAKERRESKRAETRSSDTKPTAKEKH